MIFKKPKEVAIYTALYGDRDQLKNPLYDIEDADLFCFTDNKKLKSKHFNVVYREPSHSDPNRSAKKFKVLGDPILRNYKYTFWVDGSILIKFTDPKELAEYLLQGKDIAFFGHPDGRKGFEEFEFILQNNAMHNFDDSEKIESQMNKYKSENMPEDLPVLAGGLIVRNNLSERIEKFNQSWWKEIETHSKRDQLSLPYVLWKTGIPYHQIGGLLWNNEIIEVLNHKN